MRAFDHPVARRELLAGAAVLAGFALLPGIVRRAAAAPVPAGNYPFKLSDAQWRHRLSPAAYDVLRQQGTEAPFSSPLNDEHRAGTFLCGGCAEPAYASSTKFDSGTGWPSFWAPLPHTVGIRTDTSLMMVRDEVHCARCGSHLGHVFDDGPKPTGKRFCMNGVALRFVPAAA